MRSDGSSTARSTASASWTSWRSKKDLPPSTVKRSAGRLERLLERLHAGEAPREDEHVARPARPRGAGHGVAHRLPAAREGGEVRGEPRGLRAEQVLAARVRRRGEAQRHDRGLVGEARRGRDRLVGRLVGLVRRLDEVGEDAVHEAQDGRARAEVLRRGAGRPAPPLRLARELAEQAHLGPPEAVDRLLGVAHDDERSRAVAREEPRDLDLQRVGVLELVDDEEPEAAAEPLADGGVVAQRVARLDQQVEEVEYTPLGLLAARRERTTPASAADEPAVERGPVRGRPAPDAPPSSRRRWRAPSASASGEGQCGLKPRFFWIGSSVEQVVDEGFSPRGSARPRRLRRAARAGARQGVALAAPRRRARGRARALRDELAAGPPRRRRRPRPRAARGRAGRSALRARPRSDVRSPQPSPSSGMPRSSASSEHVVAADQALAQPLLPGLREQARPPGPRRPCGSRAGRRTRAAAPGRIWAHSAWIVETLARSSTSRAALDAVRARPAAARARRRARSSRSRSRSFMVVAAFSVKVTAAISSSRAVPVRTSDSMRSTSSVVLPVPAPASSTRLVAWSRRARSRAVLVGRAEPAHPTSLQPQVRLQRRCRGP